MSISSFQFIDDFIRDYLQYRNLILTSRVFDHEISKLPVGEYRADKIIEQLTIYIHQFDLNNLIDYWTHIEQCLLTKLDIESKQLIPLFGKIRLNLYRCYLIHAVQTSRTDKINEFFERLNKTLQQSTEWTKDWYSLPFIKNPEENFLFKIYFSKQWNELFWNSLQNFLSKAFYHMISPKINTIEGETVPNEGLDSEQDHPSNLTIMSVLRKKFSTNNTQSNSIQTQFDPLKDDTQHENQILQSNLNNSLSNI